MTLPDRSIVIPVHQRSALTIACIDALLRQELAGTEIVVVDDATPGGCQNLRDRYGDRVRLVERAAQGGFGVACNDGAAVAKGHTLVFLNNDTLPTEGWLDALSAYADAHPRAGIVGCKLLFTDNTIQHAGVVVDGERKPRHAYEGFPAEHPAVNRSRRFQIVTAAAMLVVRDAFDELGGFDDAFVNGWEDVDLCLRAGERGWEVHYCHKAVVYHLEGATRGLWPHGDRLNWTRLMERWGDRLEPDDVRYYGEDGLIRVKYEDGSPRVAVEPPFAPAAGDANVLARHLARRTAHSLDLVRENVRLTLGEGPAGDPRGVPHLGEGSASVVVPLSDHGEVPEILASLGAQVDGRGTLEVLVVDSEGDGADSPVPHGLTVRFLESDPAAGRAGAFNLGIREAGGEILLLLADDFVPGERYVEAHLAAHAREPEENVAVLGPALFPEHLRHSHFMSWLEDSGKLFGASFTNGQIPQGFFYGANVSLKRRFLLASGLFDERFPRHAWDDFELGLRLFARGMVVVYEPAAAAWHEHDLSLEERLGSMRDAGRAAWEFDRIYPPPHPWTSGTDLSESPLEHGLKAQVARARFRVRRAEADRVAYYEAALRKAFLEGYREAASKALAT